MIDLALVMAGVVTQYPTPQHPAWDIACVTGRPVHAYHTGVVGTYTSPLLGKVVTVQGNDQLSLYAHLDEVTIKQDQRIERGQQLGTCGNTGKWSTGPHLHFEHTTND